MRRLSFAYHFVYLLLCLLLAYSAVVVAYNLELGHEEEKFKKEAAKAKMYQKFADDELEAAQNQSGLLFMFMGLMSADNDGDNLDLQKEVALGTDDNLIDSDGDEIPDGKDKHPAGGDQVWSIKIPWQHKGSDYSTEIAVNEDTYWYYHD
ncbi:MAG TPA: hypothetical protein VFF28_06750, partial [Candidatus Nanoarchaeia archaeon]|nr:hypothetical protein [Candidatus Nanoarchaeia archaeon]